MSDLGYDPIEVLLIDDEPKGLWQNTPAIDGRPYRPGILADRREEHPLHLLFRVRWIATPEEAREYRDLTRNIELRDPARLGEAGGPPHILILDYLLKANADPVAKSLAGDPALEEISPLPHLRRLAGKDACQQAAADTFTRLPDSEANYGCFIGGLLLAEFSAHPCVPVTITANFSATIKGSATEFFEWMLRRDTGGRLRAAGPRPSGWHRLLPQAAPHLRARLAELARHGHISVSLADLLQLTSGLPCQGIAVSSRYGVHRYPVAGLFCDHPRTAVRSEAKKWAEALIQRVLSRDAVPEIEQARQLANLLWQAGEEDELVNDRIKLANLVRCYQASPNQWTQEQEQSFKKLWQRFSSRPPNLEGVVRPNSKIGLDRNVFDLRGKLVEGCTDRIRRWAALFVLVRLIEQRQRAIQRLKSKETEIEAETLAPLREEDLYFALFPVPATPVTLEDMTSSGVVKSLRRLKDPALPPAADSAHGNLGLDAKDLLAGRPWDPNAGHYGIEAAEATILEWYALELGYPFPQWDEYARARLAPSRSGRGR